MEITYKTDRANVDWQQVAELLRSCHLADHTAEEQELVFGNSYAVVFALDCDRIVGVARALSDGLSQAAVYNIAVEEQYRGYGIGRELIRRLLDQLQGQTVILYTHPRNIALYEKLGFRRDKTAMSIFLGDQEQLKFKEQQGFFLPRGFRFSDETERADMVYHAPDRDENK